MRNRVEERGSKTEDDRVEPVREANEEIENEREAVLDVVANEGARFQVPPILDNEVSIEGTENFRIPPERRHVEDDRVEPVREANEEIENEREAVLDVVANEGASFQVPPIPDIEVSIEGTENFRVLPERRYVPGPRSSKRLRPRVSRDSSPKRKRRGAEELKIKAR
jgi:hypothetical protein